MQHQPRLMQQYFNLTMVQLTCPGRAIVFRFLEAQRPREDRELWLIEAAVVSHNSPIQPTAEALLVEAVAESAIRSSV